MADFPFPPHPLMTSDLAALHNERVRPNPVKSLNHLLELRVETHPDQVAAAFPEPASAGEWENEVFDFRRLRSSSNSAAGHYSSRLGKRSTDQTGENPIVGLLCPSGPEFLLTVFGCLRLGYGVLLLAPQLPPAAVTYLLDKTGARHLIVDQSLRKLADEALRAAPEVDPIPVIDRMSWHRPSTFVPDLPDPIEETERIAIVLHSSGSSGLPKPIRIPHRLLTSVMPYSPSSPIHSSFSTTPLYHGGITDLARALAAVEPIWFFPLHKAPVTPENVLKAVESSGDVKWFFSVPYILEMLADGEEGMEMLKRMEIVSTGGAPLGDQVGKKLVDAGVRLVSRYGSSECGFMMTSDRDFDNDREWSWLREPDTPVGQHRVFQPSAEGKAEIVLTKGWPHLTMSNREDGGYATGDLLCRHPTIPRAWKYVGRADDIIVMSNGEKTDPAPLEAALTTSPRIASAVVFGSSRSTCGALVHLTPDGPSETSSQPLDLVRPALEAANRIAPAHSRIAQDLIVFVRPDAEWPSSSKGLVQRGRALKIYEDEIDRAYAAYEEGQGTAQGEDEVYRSVRRAVVETWGHEVGDEEDLFAMGVNSVQATRIRSLLQKTVRIPIRHKLSSSIVFERPTITKLVKFFVDLQAGQEDITNDAEELNLMRHLVEIYGDFDSPPLSNGHHKKSAGSEVVLLTGATGALGAHLLHALLRTRPPTTKIICLCRAASDEEAFFRVESSRSRGLPKLRSGDRARVRCWKASLGEERLGLEDERWDELVSSVTAIIHGAWAVNFVARLSSFEKDHLKGLHNLLRLATAHRCPSPTFTFLSSGASVTSSTSSPIAERLSTDPADAAPLGYGRSKWVAEGICSRAVAALSGRVNVIRVGQICGDRSHGIWNENEYWPLLVNTTKHTGCLPAFDDHPSWIPIDVCASAIVDIAFSAGSSSDEACVFHVCNRHVSVSWTHILDVLTRRGGINAEVAPAADWLKRVEECEAKGQNISRGLLPMWQERFSAVMSSPAPTLDTTLAEKASPSLRSCGPLTDDLILKMAAHWV